MNLGYLPGSDKAVVTKRKTTLAALESVGSFLSEGAVMTIIVYRGHAGGLSEAEAVENWVQQQNKQSCIYCPEGAKTEEYPVLLSLS